MYYFSLEIVLDNEHETSITISNDTEEKVFQQFFSTLKAGCNPQGTPFKSLTLNVRVPHNAGNWGKRSDRQLSARQRQKRDDRLDRTLSNHRAWTNPIDLSDDDDHDPRRRRRPKQRVPLAPRDRRLRDEEEEEEYFSDQEEEDPDPVPPPPAQRKRGRAREVRRREEQEEHDEFGDDEEEEVDPPFANYDDAYNEYSRRYGYRSEPNKEAGARMKPAPKKRIRAVSGAPPPEAKRPEVSSSSSARKEEKDPVLKDDNTDHVDALLRGVPQARMPEPPPRNEEQQRAMENEVMGIQKLVLRFREMQAKKAPPMASIACGQVLLENIQAHVQTYYSHNEYRGESYKALQSLVKDTQNSIAQLQQQQPEATKPALPELEELNEK